MSLNINIKKIAFLSLVILLTDECICSKNIDPARQLDPVRSLFAQSNNSGKEAQGQIDALDDSTNVIVQEFRQNYQQLIDLTQYNDQLEILIDRQERKMVRVEEDIARISSLTRSVMPLMFKMIDALILLLNLMSHFYR